MQVGTDDQHLVRKRGWYSPESSNFEFETASCIPISLRTLCTWFIFTDGACEDSSTTGSVGGVLVAPNRSVLHHFGGTATQNVMSHLLRFSSHPIHELEMIPVLIALRLWSDLLKGCQLVHYIDNESVRLALLRGRGETNGGWLCR